MLNCWNVYTHKHVHKFSEMQHAIAATHATHLVICFYRVRLNARIPNEERHGFLHMSAYLNRRWMVGHYSYAYRLIPFGHLVKGLAPDRGLYMPERIKKLPKEFFDNIDKLSFQDSVR